MRLIISCFLFIAVSTLTLAQTKMDRTIKKLNKESVPYIQVAELSNKTEVILLDTREKNEYDVSHLEKAIWVGYNEFQINDLSSQITNLNSEIVVYCSIGVRSEDIGEKLLEAGYTNVTNLYGGIFQWKNEGNTVFDSSGNKTERVHAYDKYWGKLLLNGQKVYRSKNKIKEKEAVPNN